MNLRKRYYIHRIQGKIALWTFLLLASYTAVLGAVLYFSSGSETASGGGLSGIPSPGIFPGNLAEGRIWPVVVLGIPIFIGLSLLMTHRLAGPLFRLEDSLDRMAGGDVGFRIRFRAGDELQGLADRMNQVVSRQAEVLLKVQAIHQRLLEAMGEARSRSSGPDPMNRTLETLQVQIEQLEALLRQFNIPTAELLDSRNRRVNPGK